MERLVEQEVHRRNNGWSPLSTCDGHFKVQSTFSSLAHSMVPPLLLATQLPDHLVGPLEP